MPVPTSPADAPPARLAATVLLLREGATPDTCEVLMLRRHAGAGFAASRWVYPGGVVDPGDAEVDPHHWTGIDPDALADRFGRPAREVLALHVAAVRETYEEAGVLLATHRDGSRPDLAHPHFLALRCDLNDRAVTVDLATFLRDHDVVLDLGAVTYWQRWVTPIQEPRRYDTAFFVAHVPAGADASPDDIETTRAQWTTARAALDDPDFPMIFPTIGTLGVIDRLGTAQAVIDHARAQERVATVQPHILFDDAGAVTGIVLPDDERYPHELYP